MLYCETTAFEALRLIFATPPRTCGTAVAVRQAEVLRLSPIHVDVEAGITGRLLDACIGDSRYPANAAQELGRVLEVRRQIRSAHLQIDRGGRAEIQDLTDDIGGQEREGGPGEAQRQLLAQRLHVR